MKKKKQFNVCVRTKNSDVIPREIDIQFRFIYFCMDLWRVRVMIPA